MSSDDGAPRRTKLYGAIDVPEFYPPTIVDELGATRITGPIAVGEMLAGYRIYDVLGRGGMGEVLSARDDRMGRVVAIKRLRVENPSEDVLARFLREARIQGRLEHPAIVPVYELMTPEDDQPFFVMRQLAGTTLADVLPRLLLQDPATVEMFTRNVLLRAFVDVCLAIEFAHTRGVVHRDLKPANIALGDFGEVYVLDWGIARIAGDDSRDSFADVGTVVGASASTELGTVAGAILGTPGYIPPEQIRADPTLDARADVYALGCILFEILALQPLHPRGQSGIASALAGVDARASVRTPDRDVPPELDAICVQATASERESRFATARALATAVRRFLDGNRDVALRKELARTELEEAHVALAVGGSSASARRDALRAAGRALALDPTNREPADLVAHLMIEVPRELPAEVEQEIARDDYRQLTTSARFGVFAAIAFASFFPLLYAVGFRDVWYLVLGPAICAYIVVVELVVAPRNAYLSGYLAIAGNLALFALFSWITGPIAIGPGPAIVMVTLLAAHRQLIRPWLCALLATIATLSPWLLEAIGVVDARTSVVGGDIVMHTLATELAPTGTLVGLALYIASITHLAALLGRLQDNDRRGVRRTLQLQSWQLRQLMPRPQSVPLPGLGSRLRPASRSS